MPVREANEPRERSDSGAIWSPVADFHRSEARIENRANRVRVWDIVYRGLVTRFRLCYSEAIWSPDIKNLTI